MTSKENPQITLEQNISDCEVNKEANTSDTMASLSADQESDKKTVKGNEIYTLDHSTFEDISDEKLSTGQSEIVNSANLDKINEHEPTPTKKMIMWIIQLTLKQQFL